MGQYLTTKGQSPEQDHAMLQTLELQEEQAPILGEYIANG